MRRRDWDWFKGGVWVGILATSPLFPDETQSSIRRVQELSPGRPFGIGTTLLMPGAADNAEVALEEEF